MNNTWFLRENNYPNIYKLGFRVHEKFHRTKSFHARLKMLWLCKKYVKWTRPDAKISPVLAKVEHFDKDFVIPFLLHKHVKMNDQRVDYFKMFLITPTYDIYN